MEKNLSLDNLLSWDGTLDEYVDMEFPRANFTLYIRVKNLTTDMQRSLEKKSSTMVRNKNGRVEEELDEQKFANLQVYHCVTNPDLSETRLQEKFNQNGEPHDIVDKIFLPGEKIMIMKTIFRLSGFNDSDIMDMEIENLINKS